MNQRSRRRRRRIRSARRRAFIGRASGAASSATGPDGSSCSVVSSRKTDSSERRCVRSSAGEEPPSTSSRLTREASRIGALTRIVSAAGALGSSTARPAPRIDSARVASAGVSKRMTSRSSVASRFAVGPSATIRPSLRIATRLQSCSTSGRTWLERKIVVPSAARPAISSRTSTTPFGSRPFVGSSRITRSGRPINAVASASRWRIPVENPPALRRAAAARPTRSRASPLAREERIRLEAVGGPEDPQVLERREVRDRTPGARSAIRPASGPGRPAAIGSPKIRARPRVGQSRPVEDPDRRRLAGSVRARGSRRRRRPGRRDRCRRPRGPPRIPSRGPGSR